MDILTENPEVWKKTIFVLTYDENDGYFDHLAPFTAPNPYKKGTGKVSEGIDCSVEFVRKEQQSYPKGMRESSIGLGYRVPMVIASPWSRGGFVNSQVFDHTSSLQFLENFLEKKTGKKITETNISQWHRTVCGDLTSAFRQYKGEKIGKPELVNKEHFIQTINNALFKELPAGFKKLTEEEIADVNNKGNASTHLVAQEKGIRSASVLPYELYANGNLSRDKNTFSVVLRCGDSVFGKAAAGGPFYIYALNKYNQELHRSWNYAVKPGDTLKDEWDLSQFENAFYHLNVHGPNGFMRSFKGDKADPVLMVQCSYEATKAGTNKLTGDLLLTILNEDTKTITVTVADNSYKTGTTTKTILPGTTATIKMALAKSYGWYDVIVKAKGYKNFEKQFAGKVENGLVTKTDPLMGGVE
jgi:phospholipase C